MSRASHATRSPVYHSRLETRAHSGPGVNLDLIGRPDRGASALIGRSAECYWGARGAKPFTGLTHRSDATRRRAGCHVGPLSTSGCGRPSGSRSLASTRCQSDPSRARTVVNCQSAPTAAYIRDPARDDQSSSVLQDDADGTRGVARSARNVFTGHPGPRKAQDECNAEMRSAYRRPGLSAAMWVNTPLPTLGSPTPALTPLHNPTHRYAARCGVSIRFARHRSRSNGSAVCITRSSIGTSLRATAQTALVFDFPRVSSGS